MGKVRIRDYPGLSRPRDDWRVSGFRVEGGSEPVAPARFYLVVDEAGDRSAGPLSGSPADKRGPRPFPLDGSPGHELIADLRGAKIWLVRPASPD